MSHRDEQPQDLRQMWKQAERDQESRKLAVLIERVKRQLQQRELSSGLRVEAPRPPVAAVSGAGVPRTSSRSFFER